MQHYEGDPTYRPISAWGYVGYSILFSIPVIGWIFLIVYTFSGKNINRRSFARSYWAKALLLIVAMCALTMGVVKPFIRYSYGQDGTYRNLTSEIAVEVLRNNLRVMYEDQQEAEEAENEIMEDLLNDVVAEQ